MEAFNQFLKRKGLSKGSVTSINKNLMVFFRYLKEECIPADALDYSELLSFINFCTEKGNDKSSINYKLRCIRYYFEYLIATKKRKDNPALELSVRGIPKKVLNHLLTEEELKGLYENYKALSPVGIRNKVIVSLIVNQGITTKELNKLYVEDINLKNGLVSLSGSRKSNGRELKLERHQVKLLQRYLDKVRPVLIDERKADTDKLIVNTGKGDVMIHLLKNLLLQLKEQNNRLKNFQQIRDSVITLWLNKHDLRIVQYMAGHRYVSSTEKYKANNIEQLKDVMEGIHPLK